MHPTLKRLIKMVPPPNSPVDCGSETAFKEVEQQLGLPLPPDYKEYVAAYGSGGWHALSTADWGYLRLRLPDSVVSQVLFSNMVSGRRVFRAFS